jgi:amphi-Trp domain-containing protein
MKTRSSTGRFKRARRAERDLEKVYSKVEFISKLRRLADALENGRRFRIQLAGERVSIPPTATFNIEHEREGDAEEVEFQLTWNLEE